MAREEKTFDPLIRWIEDELNLKLSVSDTFMLSHPPEALPRARELLTKADDWDLAALDAITSSSKSLVIAMAVAHGKLDAASAAVAARVAEQYQVDEWGMVEAGHDLDAANVAVDIASASAFLRLLRADEPL